MIKNSGKEYKEIREIVKERIEGGMKIAAFGRAEEIVNYIDSLSAGCSVYFAGNDADSKNKKVKKIKKDPISYMSSLLSRGFDLIISVDFLNHELGSDEAVDGFLKKARKSLSDSGTLIISEKLNEKGMEPKLIAQKLLESGLHLERFKDKKGKNGYFIFIVRK